MISQQTWSIFATLYRKRAEALTEAVGEVIKADPAVEAEEFDTAWREALLAQRSTFTSLLRDGIITEDTFNELIGEVDLALTANDINWNAFVSSIRLPEIHSLFTVFIQEQDAENVINALNKLGFSVTRLSSVGAHLRKRNLTLLIGVPAGHEAQAIETLEAHCQHRLETEPFSLSKDSVKLSAATIFSFEVERYEEL